MSNVIRFKKTSQPKASRRALLIDISIPLTKDPEYRAEEQSSLLHSLERFAGNYRPEETSELQYLLEEITGCSVKYLDAGAGDGALGDQPTSSIEIDLTLSLLSDGGSLAESFSTQHLHQLIQALSERFPYAQVELSNAAALEVTAPRTPVRL